MKKYQHNMSVNY